MFLKQLLAYKTRKSEKDNLSSRKSISFKKAENVGILFSNNDPEKNSVIDRLISELKHDGKKVKVLAFEQNTSIRHLPYDSFSRRDINFWCKYLKPNLTNFVEREFDFLICPDDPPGALISNVLAMSKAKCRVGRPNNQNKSTFELMISSKDPSPNNWVASMYDYLKKIN